MAITSLIIDTSAYSAMLRGNNQIALLLSNAQYIYVPSIVIGELKAGFAFGTKRNDNEKLLTKFLSDPSVSVVTITENTPDNFAEIYAELRNDGKPIGQNDLWIASLARELQLPLMTMDSDFNNVAGLKIVDLNKN